MTEEEKDEYMLLMAKEFAVEMNTALVSKFLPMEYVAAVRTVLFWMFYQSLDFVHHVLFDRVYYIREN